MSVENRLLRVAQVNSQIGNLSVVPIAAFALALFDEDEVQAFFEANDIDAEALAEDIEKFPELLKLPEFETDEFRLAPYSADLIALQDRYGELFREDPAKFDGKEAMTYLYLMFDSFEHAAIGKVLGFHDVTRENLHKYFADKYQVGPSFFNNQSTALVKVAQSESVEEKRGKYRPVAGAKERMKVKGFIKSVSEEVYDQDEAISVLQRAFATAAVGFRENDKPVGSFLFKGPTGVGKTELAKQTASYMGRPLLRVDMSEYSQDFMVTRLFGSPPGYVNNDEGGILTNFVKEHPDAILLLDEIEEAHSDAFNILLQVMDNARLTSGQMEEVDFSNTLLIMTSNAGTGGKEMMGIGFGEQETRNTADDDLERLFLPKFRNRLDAIVTFNHLTSPTVRRISDKLERGLEEVMARQNMVLHVTDEAHDWLAAKGYDREMGARPLKRLFEREVKNQIADRILDKGPKRGAYVIHAADDGRGLKLQYGAISKLAKEEKPFPLVKTEPSIVPAKVASAAGSRSPH